MRAVSNTSPISNLSFIGRLGLLREQFEEVWIPAAVEEELRRHPDAEARAAIQAAIRDGWLRVVSLRESALKSLLLQQVHRGEAEAIALAVEWQLELLIIDEQEGRALALQSGIEVTGTLGILLKAKKSGLLGAVTPELQALRSKTRFFLSRTVEMAFLREAGE